MERLSVLTALFAFIVVQDITARPNYLELKDFPAPMAGFNPADAVGTWYYLVGKTSCSFPAKKEYSDYHLLLMNDHYNKVAIELYARYRGECGTLKLKMEMTSGNPADMKYRDTIGLLSGKIVIVDTDYTQYLIIWGCDRLGFDNNCDDPWLAAMVRNPTPTTHLLKTINGVLKTRWNLGFKDLDSPKLNENPCPMPSTNDDPNVLTSFLLKDNNNNINTNGMRNMNVPANVYTIEHNKNNFNGQLRGNNRILQNNNLDSQTPLNNDNRLAISTNNNVNINGLSSDMPLNNGNVNGRRVNSNINGQSSNNRNRNVNGPALPPNGNNNGGFGMNMPPNGNNNGNNNGGFGMNMPPNGNNNGGFGMNMHPNGNNNGGFGMDMPPNGNNNGGFGMDMPPNGNNNGGFGVDIPPNGNNNGGFGMNMPPNGNSNGGFGMDMPPNGNNNGFGVDMPPNGNNNGGFAMNMPPNGNNNGGFGMDMPPNGNNNGGFGMNMPPNGNNNGGFGVNIAPNGNNNGGFGSGNMGNEIMPGNGPNAGFSNNNVGIDEVATNDGISALNNNNGGGSNTIVSNNRFNMPSNVPTPFFGFGPAF